MEHRSIPEGLTSAQASALLEQHGPNEIRGEERTALLSEFLSLVTSPLIVVLLASTLLLGLLGEWTNAGIIAGMVLLSLGLNFLQTYRSHAAIERLKDHGTPSVEVVRDGAWQTLFRRELVPGDWFRVTAGNQVPADGTLVEAVHLNVEQGALTGESMPVEKMAHPDAADSAGPDAEWRVFRGTSVVSGSAIARVTATGAGTVYGQIAARLSGRHPPTELDRGLHRFSMLITRTIFVLVLFVLAINLLQSRGVMDSLLFAIALAIGLTPEFLPVISTVVLGRGAIRMARHHVIVKRLGAISNFGSIDVLCCDKTGTLTTGVMHLVTAVDATGAASSRPAVLARINSSLQTGVHNPLDECILQSVPADQTPTKLAEIPFDYERRRVSVIVNSPNGPLLISKGAPEGLMELSTTVEINGIVTPWNDTQRSASEAVVNAFSGQGYRVLAVAWRTVSEQSSYDAADETGLTLSGFLAFADPPLPDAAHILALLRHDGVRVMILTGDNETAARETCRRVGLSAEEVVVGADVREMTDDALAHVAERTNLFARVSPAEKNRILRALKKRGHVVGYVGDGINDAPCLFEADVGISVSGATDVARDAADIVVQERGLRVLHRGILEGRHAFANVLKYLLMGTSSNFGNMFSMAVASAVLPFLPMLPMQILLNNFLYDVAQVPIPGDHVDTAFLRKPRRWRMEEIRRFMLLVGPISSLFDFLTFWVLLHVFHAGEELFHSGWFVESLLTQTLVLFVIRTADRPWRSHPSPALIWTVATVVTLAMILPATPLAPAIGMTPLPAGFYGYVIAATATYLTLAEWMKRRIFRSLAADAGYTPTH